MDVEKYLNNLKYLVLEKAGISYSTQFLELNEYFELEKNCKFQKYPISLLKTYKAFLLREKEILVVNNDLAHFQIYKSKEDFTNYLELAYGDKYIAELIEQKDVNKSSFVNSNYEIIDFEKSVEIPNDNEGKYSVKEVDEYLIFSSEYDYLEYKKLDGKPVFCNVNPYGKNLLAKKDYLTMQLAKRLNISITDLDFSIDSLARIDKVLLAKVNFSQHFFYSIYLPLTVYFGYCLSENNEQLKMVLVSNEGVIEPEIHDEVNDVEISLSIYIYENYINSQNVVLMLTHLYAMLKPKF